MKFKSLAPALLIFAAGFGSSLLMNQFLSSNTTLSGTQPIRDDNEYQYVNPLLLCGISEQVESNDFDYLKNTVEQDLAAQTESSDVVSVYFRELDTGEWFSINPEETFSPASLLKLPLFIAYMKMAESQPSILTTEVTINETDWNETQNFPPKNPTIPGKKYTVTELLFAMLNDSDNNATYALNTILDENFKNEIYTDLGLDLPSNSSTEQFMTAKNYSHFFRVLYNASYLNHANSEQSLALMTQSNFSEGLASGMPDSVAIAEKFGERKIENSQGEVVLYELHDCGIVYATSKPYLLCVMSKSPVSFEHLSTLIQTVSRAVYNEMASPRAGDFSAVKS
ncbi:MAG: serine hydrolase [Patescibacteria group bacterium]